MNRLLLFQIFVISFLLLSTTVYAQTWEDFVSFISNLRDAIFSGITGLAVSNETNTTNQTTPPPPITTTTAADLPPDLTLSVKSANELHPSTIYAGLRAYITVTVTDDKGISSASFNAPGMKYSSADVNLYQCSGGVKSCSEPVYIIVPDKPGSYTVTAKATDTASQTTTKTVTFTAVGCSADSECGGTYFPSSGATFCGPSGASVYDKRMKYQVVSICVSGSCSEKTEPGVLEDCATSGKICGFSPLLGGQFQCVTAPSNTCAANVSITSKCMCGPSSYEGYGYCCLDSSGKLYHLSSSCPPPQTCPTCSSPSAWSACIAVNNTYNNQTRTNYKCDSTTNYICQTYTEYQSCTPPATPTGYCGDNVCSGNETATTCLSDCVKPVIPPTTPQSNTTTPQPIIQPNLTTPQERTIPLPVPTPLPTHVQPSAEPTKPLPAIDRLRLAQSILTIEGLKIKFENFKAKSQSLLKYYTVKNETKSIEKWNTIVELFDQAIDALNDIKLFISSIRDTSTESNLDEIVTRIDNVLLIIDKVIDVMLSG